MLKLQKMLGAHKIPPKLIVMVIGWLGICLSNTYLWAGDTNGKYISNDTSWIMSLSGLLKQGQLTGRDSLFLYGPLTQVIAWLGTSLHATGSVFDGYGFTLYAFLAFGAALLCIGLVLLRSINWKQAAFILIVYEILIPVGLHAFRMFAAAIYLILFGIILALKTRL